MRAAFECVDWDDTEEVTTLFYMTKDLVEGRRAADELMLDWDDVERVEATAETAAGAVRSVRVERNWRRAADSCALCACCRQFATRGQRTTLNRGTSRRGCRA